jgi:hypothetical protein
MIRAITITPLLPAIAAIANVSMIVTTIWIVPRPVSGAA